MGIQGISRQSGYPRRGIKTLLEMAETQEQLEIKFRLHDGSDIGPSKYSPATTVATLKESILAQWPKEKENGPRTVNDLKLINAGRILENNKTLGECRSPICDIPGGVTTMHVVVRHPSLEKGAGTNNEVPPEKKKASNQPQNSKCACVIL
ncbi:Membrane-anchored ubiquitin-fold protein 1 [Acorus calamus]|uniref:Membrane-anchored ubiquitin-fold protein 1 n=1 Tax=Acorus calamus TaxID=4465 RepID=A0AAV9CVN5_ACOCL|nr:Membrane-anchored ubiquitin-fold protein 1 [Acorus calamus]